MDKRNVTVLPVQESDQRSGQSRRDIYPRRTASSAIAPTELVGISVRRQYSSLLRERNILPSPRHAKWMLVENRLRTFEGNDICKFCVVRLVLNKMFLTRYENGRIHTRCAVCGEHFIFRAGDNFSRLHVTESPDCPLVIHDSPPREWMVTVFKNCLDEGYTAYNIVKAIYFFKKRNRHRTNLEYTTDDLKSILSEM